MQKKNVAEYFALDLAEVKRLLTEPGQTEPTMLACLTFHNACLACYGFYAKDVNVGVVPSAEEIALSKFSIMLDKALPLSSLREIPDDEVYPNWEVYINAFMLLGGYPYVKLQEIDKACDLRFGNVGLEPATTS